MPRGEVEVADDRVTVTAVADDEQYDHPAVALRVDSDRPGSATVRVELPLPDGTTPSDCTVLQDPEDWSVERGRLVFETGIGPGGGVVTGVEIDAPLPAIRERLSDLRVEANPARGTDVSVGGAAGTASTGATGSDGDGDGPSGSRLPGLPSIGWRGIVVVVLLVAFLGVGSVFVSLDGDDLSVYQELKGPTDPLDGDTDGDGLADHLEVRSFDSDPTDADTDDDGLDDATEFAIWSEPREADTDGDGLDDGREWELNTSVKETDPDEDGLNDPQELEHGTHPRLADTDGDGLDDPEEVRAATDPTEWDTDGDGLSDAWELDYRADGLDPTDPDVDGDGLDDGREIRMGLFPRTPDLDGDGLDDGAELAAGTNPAIVDTDCDYLTDPVEVDGQTDPVRFDADGDGLSTARELDLGTDPTNPDTDGDNLPDGLEVSSTLPGADPLRTDVFVEIDYMPGQELSAAERQRLVEAFAGAPVSNPDGSRGITLHLRVDEEVPHRGDFQGEDLEEYERQHQDYPGHLYAVLAPDSQLDGEGVAGFSGGVRFASSSNPAVFMHELGHSLGLRPTIEGVDSKAVPFDEYPSGMNYNAPQDYVGFSAGDDGARDHDDWAAINREPWAPSVADLVDGNPECTDDYQTTRPVGNDGDD